MSYKKKMWICLNFFFLVVHAVDWTTVHYGHTTVVARTMVGRDKFSVDSVVFKHGVHHERFHGSRREV